MSADYGLVRALARGKMLLGVVAASMPLTAMAFAQDKDPFAVVELGAAGEWSRNDAGSSLGPAAAVEFSSVKNWLEIEAGVTTLFSRGQTEWSADLVFKKPFDLSPSVEFEPGIGPAWIHTTAGRRAVDSVAAEVVADFMFWPTSDRKYGWFVEPTYSYGFGNGDGRSFGVSAGLLIAIP